MSEPYVHGLYSPTTQTWQYVVADPATGYCAIFDPMRDVSHEEVNVSTNPADEVLALVKRRGYFVQCIIETRTSQATVRSAAWNLRMRLKEWQGQAPALYSRGAAVDVMARMFDRKYGAKSGFTSTIQRPLGDGEVTMVGQMRVMSLPIAESGVPSHTAFLIGRYLFGAHSLVQRYRGVSASSDDRKSGSVAPMGEKTWSSLQRAFAGQERLRVYFDEGPPMQEKQREPFDEVDQFLPLPKESLGARRQIDDRGRASC